MLLAGTALLMVVSGTAMAADLSRPAPAPAPVYTKAPMMAPLFTWTGCHIGGNIGGKWATTSGSVDIPAATGPGGASPASTFALADTTASTLIGGGQIGCDYQTGVFVFGVEGDVDWQKWSTSRTVGAAFPALFVPGDTFDVSSNWQASARGRLGYAMDRTLIYITGGAAWTNVSVGTNFIPIGVFPATVASESKTLLGGTLGGGLDYAVTNNVILGIEGRYTWYGSQTFNAGLLSTSGGPPFTTAAATQTIKLNTAEVMGKLDFKFGGGY
jgi:outer membrane immunogenic protein